MKELETNDSSEGGLDHKYAPLMLGTTSLKMNVSEKKQKSSCTCRCTLTFLEYSHWGPPVSNDWNEVLQCPLIANREEFQKLNARVGLQNKWWAPTLLSLSCSLALQDYVRVSAQMESQKNNECLNTHTTKFNAIHMQIGYLVFVQAPVEWSHSSQCTFSRFT